MDFDSYQWGVMRTANKSLTKIEARMNAALGLGEAGEVQNIVKKEVFHGHSEDRTKILDELGDVLYYVAWLAHTYEWSLAEVAEYNHMKLVKRYPDGFDSQRSINRPEES